MFCPKCGKKNDDNSLFCTWCGAGFGSVSTQSLSAAPAASAPVEAPATHQELQTVSAAPIVSAENFQAAQSAGEIKQPEPTEQPAYSVPTPGVIPQSSAEHTAAQNSASGALNAQAAPGSAANLLSFNNEVPVASARKGAPLFHSRAYRDMSRRYRSYGGGSRDFRRSVFFNDTLILHFNMLLMPCRLCPAGCYFLV